LYFVPVSALVGDNIVARSRNMPWFEGRSLLEHLETVPVGGRVRAAAFRFPVQRVVRPDQEFRGYAGTIASGTVRPGDRVVIWPSGRETAIARIVTFDGDLAQAEAGKSVTLTLTQEIDLSRGDVIASREEAPQKTHAVEATLVWLNEKPAEVGKRYRLKHAARQDWATLKQIDRRISVTTLEEEPGHSLELNAIGQVTIETARAFVFDNYARNRATGSFILIDPASNATVAAGMISAAAESSAIEPLAGISWRVEKGALILASEEGFTASEKGGEPLQIEDPEALEALRHLLRRLQIRPFSADASEADWEI
jgi:sulfate adenylyltransferase subunit 1 (EFTu-like GTPase family)